jgi:hypothetical protein
VGKQDRGRMVQRVEGGATYSEEYEVMYVCKLMGVEVYWVESFDAKKGILYENWQ